MRALVVGCGSIGRRHLRVLKSVGVADLHAFDPSAERLEDIEADRVSTLEEGLARKPDAVFVCTPTAFHLKPALQAARAGCHLFIEKPLSHTLDGVEELEREVSSRRLTVLVGCNMRFHPGVALAKSLLREGAVGRPLHARAVTSSYLPDWRPGEDYRRGYSADRCLGGGALLDCIHELDYMLDLLGDAVEVGAFVEKLSDLELKAEDTAELAWKTSAGTLVSVHVDFITRAYRRTLSVAGTDGVLEWDFSRPEVRLFRGGAWETVSFHAPGPDDMYVAQARHFMACLAGSERPAQGLPEARRVLALALAAKRSSEEKRRVPL